MRTPEEYEEGIERQRADWKDNYDHVGKTSSLWAVAAVLLCVWTLGLVSSTTLDGGIHLAFAGSIVLMVAAWARTDTIKSRSGWGRR